MSKADEMFKKLGYEIQKTEKEIMYIKYGHYNDEIIEIDLCHRQIIVMSSMGDSLSFTIDELKAINEKAKELGWLDE